MSYQPIEDHGMIGNMRTIALVATNGMIDWYCYPYFDSPSLFGAILDDQKGGRFQISPVSTNVKFKQLYWPSTNVLVTRFLLAEGVVELQDFMPVGLSSDSPWYHQLFRRVRCVRGNVEIRILCEPAFDYGRKPHETLLESNGASFRADDLKLSLSSPVSLRRNDKNGVEAEFSLKEGDSKVFILRGKQYDECVQCPPSDPEGEDIFQTTVCFWRNWLSGCTYYGRWLEAVHRSALALKLLTFEPTGAIVAAPTTSLPETIGGPRNWDYRYSWIRDSAFTIYGFLRIGFRSEALGFVNWLENFVSKNVSPGTNLMPMFTIHGDAKIPEHELLHWEGYRGSRPVRIGNAAVDQFQNDLYGELVDTFYLFNKYAMPVSYDFWMRIRDSLNWVCEHWNEPDHGVWEMRNRREHFVYSKVMNWVALDRGIRLAEKRSFPSEREKWTRVRDRIYEEILKKGWNDKRKAFTQYYDSEDLDASLLILPLTFFMAPTDPRMLSTIKALQESPREGGLVSDGLVYRYPPKTQVDGLSGVEGTFNMCTFWLVEALTRAGQVMPEMLDQARYLFEKMLGYANHIGLYAEQTGPQGEALGNFPQAFTHLALISAAFNLDRSLGRSYP